jgi:Na+/melibiose symporter-like transporter
MLAIAVTSQRTLRRRANRPKVVHPFDYRGALAFSTFLVSLLLTLTLGPGTGWLEPATLAGAAAALLLLVVFIAVERRNAAPMIDLALFRNAEFALGALAALVTFMGIASTRFLVPFFLQAVRGIPAQQVGVLIVPAAVVTAIAAPFAGRFADRFGIRLFANVGMAITLLGFATFCLIDIGTPIWRVVAGLMVMSLGMSLFSAANSASMLNAVEEHSHGLAAGFVTLCRNSGNVVGIAFGTVIVTLTMGALGYPPTLAAVGPSADPSILHSFTAGVGYASVALCAIVLAVLAVLVAWSWRAHARRLAASRGALTAG